MEEDAAYVQEQSNRGQRLIMEAERKCMILLLKAACFPVTTRNVSITILNHVQTHLIWTEITCCFKLTHLYSRCITHRKKLKIMRFAKQIKVGDNMRLKDFIRQKCADIINKASALSMDAIPEMFSYDDLIDNGFGEMVKVIYDDNNNPIQISDIIGLTIEDFQQTYQFDSALSAFHKYMSAYNIIEGEALYRQLQRQIEDYRDEMVKFEKAAFSDFQW